jgi:hypothetical protein
LSSLVTIERCTNPIEAHILAGRLEVEGVRAFVANEHHIWANWFLSNALQGVKVQVTAEQAAEAAEILVRLRAGEFSRMDGFSAEACPHCGVVAALGSPRSQQVALLALWFFTLPLPFSKWRRRCRACGLDS